MRDSATILLVEDDQSLLDGISDLLEVADMGYQVHALTASNGRAGLARIAEATPDLIISDIMMPLMDGFEFLAEVRKNPAWIHIPFIFLTARGEKRDIQEGRSSGAELYITKPFDNDELLQLVKGQLDRTFQLQFVRQQRLDNLKRSILQLLNHEFRTPLTYVTAYYEMLADGLSIEASNNLQEYLKGIQAGCVRLTKLVQDLIAVVELRTGETAAHYRQQARPLSDPGALLREAGQQAAALAQSKGMILSEDIPADLPPIFGVPEYLHDILARLIDNAIKFTHCKREPGGYVHLSAESSQDEVRFTVADNGIGFPDHVHSQLFDLFFQYNREQLEQQGSGSGLAITKGLAELHQGRIDVESEKGAGSRFSLVLPVYNPASAEAAGGPAQMRKQATILVVEDDRFLLDGLRELLEISDGAYHFRILTANNGRLGLEVLARHHPDLIISDIMMPEMDGFQFLTEVRRNPAWLHIPFIFLTARGEREAWLEGLRIGVEDYITKPYDSDQLLEMVTTQLNRHFQRQSVVYQSFEDLKRSILDLLQPDFRLPLDTVARYSDQMAQNLESAETPEDLKESLRGIEVGSNRLNRLVRDFITLAELRTGEAAESFALEARLLNAGSLLMEAAQLQQHEAGEGRVNLSLAIDHTLPEVRADDKDLSSSFARLIAVLIQLHIDSRPVQLHLNASSNGRYINLNIGRSGPGFDASTAQKVHALLRDNDQAILESADYGPSLVILKGVIDLHGGQISLENDPVAGCTFTIRLPVYRP